PARHARPSSSPCGSATRGRSASSDCGCGARGRSSGRPRARPSPTRSRWRARGARRPTRGSGSDVPGGAAVRSRPAAGDEAARREALEILEGLGAGPKADAVRNELRARGVRNLPRGPRAATRENAAGLTARQLEVLALLADGLSNADIGERLFISAK